MTVNISTRGGPHESTAHAAPELFSSQGEMSALCRAFDWCATSLGPTDTWSHSLRTTVMTVLESRHPMFLFWGADLVQIYNDAYRPSLAEGGRHPRALGKRGKDFWTEIWDIIGPQIDGVMTRGEATWHVDQLVPIERNGRIEDVYWTYSYSPVRDDDGSIAATLVVCQETTSRVLTVTERRATEESMRAAHAELEARVFERTAELAQTNRSLADEIEARRRAELDRNALLLRLATAQEDERRRLSRELHDEMGQHLAGLSLGIQTLADVTPQGGEGERRVAQLRTHADALGRELHSLAVRLRPRALDDFGLEPALATHVDDWSRQSGIQAQFHSRGAKYRLPTEVENAIYRVVQEGLNNVAKHSHATRASVVLERRDGDARAIVEDNGRGFNTAPAARQAGTTGLGLLGIRERVSLLGGSLEVESTAEAGTTLFVRIPIRGEEAARGVPDA